MDLIFEYPAYESAREKVKHPMRQLKKPLETLKTHCTLVSNKGATRYFPLQNRSDLLMRKQLLLTSVVIVTINGGTDNASAKVAPGFTWTNHFDCRLHLVVFGLRRRQQRQVESIQGIAVKKLHRMERSWLFRI